MQLEDIESIVKIALDEDVGDGDISADLISEDATAFANIISREDAVFCGRDFADAVFAYIDDRVDLNWAVHDGDHIHRNQVLCSLRGPASSMLTAERTAINFLQMLSAVSTQTRKFVDAISKTKVRILDTRKTLPGLRLAQKYAVLCGGGKNHRLGLYDAFLIKENHIHTFGNIANVIQKARNLDAEKILEIEVNNLQELSEALDAKPDIIMLDNFKLPAIKKAVAMVAHGVKLEVSGNVNLRNVRSIAATGVDYISVGALTKNIKAIDLSMRFV